MRYFHYKLSEGIWGTNPYDAVAALGSLLDPSRYVNHVDGYRLAYVTGDCDPDDLDAGWDAARSLSLRRLRSLKRSGKMPSSWLTVAFLNHH